MKLIYCPVCGDIRKLDYADTLCSCENSWGHYEPDGLHAVIGGQAIPIGIHNAFFKNALEMERIRTENEEVVEWGIRFEAFTIPACASTVRRET